jgi:drug/metabolite transporter (DMT)-like permease
VIGRCLLLISVCCWPLGVIASKAVLDRTGTSPIPALTIQLCGSVVGLWLVARVRGQAVRPVLRFGWTGLLEPGLAYFAALIGLSLTSASSATVLGALEPIMIPLVAWLIVRERPTRTVVGVTVVAALGAIVAAWPTDRSNHSLVGDLLVVVGVAVAAFYVVVASQQIHSHDASTLTLSQHIWALGLVGLCAACVSLSGFVDTAWPTHLSEYLWIAASGVLAYALPFATFMMAMQRVALTEAGSYLTLIPVTGLGAAAVILDERPTATQLVGCLIVVSALIMLARVKPAAS